MYSARVLSVAVALLCVANIGLCYDLEPLQETVGSLCALNNEGLFSACCAVFNNGTDLTMDGATECFFEGIDTSSDVITGMFAQPISLSPLCALSVKHKSARTYKYHRKGLDGAFTGRVLQAHRVEITFWQVLSLSSFFLHSHQNTHPTHECSTTTTSPLSRVEPSPASRSSCHCDFLPSAPSFAPLLSPRNSCSSPERSLSAGSLKEIPTSAFSDLTKLKALHPSPVYPWLPSRLRHIRYLGYNNIESIPSDAFAALKSLELLWLPHLAQIGEPLSCVLVLGSVRKQLHAHSRQCVLWSHESEGALSSWPFLSPVRHAVACTACWHLNNNRITSIDADSFSGLNVLKSLPSGSSSHTRVLSQRMMVHHQ